jgi:nitroreductase
LLVVDERGGPAAEQFLRGGMALQHVWLCATRLGLAVQPMAPAVFLFARLEANATEGLGAWTVDALQRDHGTYRRLFGLEPHDLPILLFRIARAEPPTSRSLRRPIEDVLQLA